MSGELTLEGFLAALLLASLVPQPCWADDLPPPGALTIERPSARIDRTLTILRWSEDYSFLSGVPRSELSAYERLKFIPLDENGANYMSLGGELRERVESYSAPAYGIGPAGARNFTSFAERALVNADLHLGPDVRFFVQLGAYGEGGRRPAPRPVDRSAPDVAQAFVDLALPGEVAGGQLSARLGRQQLGFGSGRLVSIRDATNIQRSFDAAKVSFAAKFGLRIDAFVGGPVAPMPGAFDDQVRGEMFSGIYATSPILSGGHLNLDVYFLNRERDSATYSQTTARERRRTIGSRVWGRSGGWDYDLEGAYQFGSFGTGDLRAWGVASDIGYTFEAPLRPRLGLKANIASGDHDPRDRVLQTFDALYPAIDYFSTAAIYAPTNGVDVQPSLRLNWMPNFWTQLGVDVFRRLRDTDAFYNAVGLPIVSGRAGGGALGTELVNFDAAWQVTPKLQLKFAFTEAIAEGALRRAGGRNQTFGLIQASLRF